METTNVNELRAGYKPTQQQFHFFQSYEHMNILKNTNCRPEKHSESICPVKLPGTYRVSHISMASFGSICCSVWSRDEQFQGHIQVPN